MCIQMFVNSPVTRSNNAHFLWLYRHYWNRRPTWTTAQRKPTNWLSFLWISLTRRQPWTLGTYPARCQGKSDESKDSTTDYMNEFVNAQCHGLKTVGRWRPWCSDRYRYVGTSSSNNTNNTYTIPHRQFRKPKSFENGKYWLTALMRQVWSVRCVPTLLLVTRACVVRWYFLRILLILWLWV
jgi:hypothetical protein